MKRIINQHFLTIVIAACLNAYSTFALALPDDRKQPINVSADSAEKNSNKGITIYKGNVEITQGSIRITGAIITIYDTNGTVEKMIATGSPATFKQTPSIDEADMIATGNSIEYDVSKETLVIVDNARLQQAGRETDSNRITYDMKTTIVTAGDSSGRVKMTLQPTK